MIRTVMFRTPVAACTLLTGAILCWSAAADAYTISLTGGSSGGNPGGQPLYQVTGLVAGDSFDVSWGGVSGLDVTGTVTVDSLSATNAGLSVTLDNMSTPISGGNPRVTSVGLEVGGFSSLASTVTGGSYLTLADDSNFPGYTVDACATSGNNCAGGGSGGIPAGGNDAVTLDLDGTYSGTLTLANFGLKIQGGPGGNSFELAGVPVPEPASVVLLAVGMAMLGVRPFLRRRTTAGPSAR
jgi:hypothetical protein